MEHSNSIFVMFSVTIHRDRFDIMEWNATVVATSVVSFFDVNWVNILELIAIVAVPMIVVTFSHCAVTLHWRIRARFVVRSISQKGFRYFVIYISLLA